jgi:hypothetical protein
MTATILACTGCGRTKPGPTCDPSDLFPSAHCGDCPPWICETCGEACSAVALCSCWISLAGMPLADVKAIFAGDGTFNLQPVTDSNSP